MFGIKHKKTILNKEDITPKNIRKITSDGIDLNEIGSKGETLFYVICYRFTKISADVISTMLECGADPNKGSSGDESAFHIICLYSKNLTPELIEDIIRHKGDPNKRTQSSGHTPLHYLCKRKNRVSSDMIQAMVDGGADLTLLSNSFKSPLHDLLKYQKDLDIECVKTLVSNGNLINSKKYSESPLHCFCEYGRPSLENLKALVSLGANIHEVVYDQSIFHIICMNEATPTEDTIEYMISEGLDINKRDSRGKAPLYHLLKEGKDVTPELAEYMISKGASVDYISKGRKTPFHYICMNEEAVTPKFIDYMTSKKMDINQKDKRGRTPLHYLFDTYNISPETILTSLKNGGDVCVRNDSGYTPMYRLCIRMRHSYRMYGSASESYKCLMSGRACTYWLSEFKGLNKMALYILLDKIRDPKVLKKSELYMLLKEIASEFPEHKEVGEKTTQIKEAKQYNATTIVLRNIEGRMRSFNQDFVGLIGVKEFENCSIGHGLKGIRVLVEKRSGHSVKEVMEASKDLSREAFVRVVEWMYGKELWMIKDKSERNSKWLEIETFFKSLEGSSVPWEKKSFRNDIKEIHEESKGTFAIKVKDGAEEKVIHMHPFILSARSELYKGLFKTSEKKYNEVRDNSQKSFEVIKMVHDFLYLDSIPEITDFGSSFWTEKREEDRDEIISEIEECLDFYQLNGMLPIYSLLYDLFSTDKEQNII